MIKKFISTTVYVSNDGNDSKLGTFFEPVKTIQQAVDKVIAMNMVTKYGMSDVVGNRIVDQGGDEVFIGREYGHRSSVSESLSAVIDSEVKKIIDGAYEEAKRILTENIDKLHRVAELLIAQEKIEGDEFDAIMTE